VSPEERQLRRRWRFYRTAAGHEPVADFLNRLDRDDRAAVAAKLRQVVREGVTAARHLRGEIHEVRAEGDRQSFRVLFAQEGRGRVLLALEALSKKTQRTPPEAIRLAERRLAEWRARDQKGGEQTR
jgi:phage-related protein